ncbi:MAG: DUF3667 domain-containing protein [Flavobacteriales bacterium]
MATCKNCGAPVSGAFCASCGQKASTERIGWHWLVHEVQHSIFHVDKGILFTLKELFIRPGRMLGDFLEGQRKRHFPPLSLMLVLAAVYSLLFHFFVPDLSGFKGVQLETMEASNRLLGERYALFELASLPVFSVCSWLLLRRYGHNFTEHLVMNAFLGGQRIVFNIAALPFNSLGARAMTPVFALLFLLYLGYFVFGFTQLYEKQNSTTVVIRCMVAFVLFWVFVLALSIIWFLMRATAP